MIIEIEYKKSYFDEFGKWHQLMSLVKCDDCGKERCVYKCNVLRGEGVKYCKNCACKRAKLKKLLGRIEYQDIENKTGYKHISEIPANTMEKSLWRCEKCAHEWLTTYNRLKQGRGCPKCSNNIKKNNEDYLKLAKQSNFEFLGPLPQATSYDTFWKCGSCNYTWKTYYSNINSGCGCPKCAKCLPKIEQDYLDLAIKMGLIFVGPFVKRVQIKTNWLCGCGNPMFKCFWEIKAGATNCKKCRYEKTTGKNNYNYNPYIPKQERIEKRHTINYYKWTKNILTKFNYTCQKCNQYGGNLNCHHIFNWHNHFSLRYIIENGILLCKKCHQSFHNKYGKKSNNILQIEEFLDQKIETKERAVLLFLFKRGLSNFLYNFYYFALWNLQNSTLKSDNILVVLLLSLKNKQRVYDAVG